MKLYFVTSCKPNHDERVKTRQVNAIKSWKWLNCDKEIFVFNKNPQITEMCEELGVTLIDEYESSDKSDLPTWRAMRDYGAKLAGDDEYIIWVNSDIIFDESLLNTIKSIESQNLKNFILTGKRMPWDDYYDLNDKDMLKNIPFKNTGDVWEIDYFVFKKIHFLDSPKFYIARMRFDNYLMQRAIHTEEFTIDCTQTINAIHHTHGYGNESKLIWHEYVSNNGNVKEEVDENQRSCGHGGNIEQCRYITKNEDNTIKVIKK
jgi:hypothetical protein